MQGPQPSETWAVTGAGGFLGGHILTTLRSEGGAWRTLIGMSRTAAEGRMAVDLRDRRLLAATLQEIRPDVVIHAAGTTRADDPDSCFELNTRTTLILLESLRGLDRRVRVVLLGSAAELGPVPVEELPVGPDYSARPTGAYGLSKYLATCAGLVAPGPLDVRVARIFNPIGPDLPESQAFGRFARLLKSNPSVLTVGELDSRRDFVDVRDVVSAVAAIAERGTPGTIYHVGTGESHSVREGLEELISLHGRPVDVRVQLRTMGGSGPMDSRADNRSLVEETGWSPRFNFRQSLRDLWEAC